MQSNGFDKIANVYDALARLVFGKAIRQAQNYFLNDIPSQSKVLILGGGSGWLLSQMLKSNPQCEIWYIEASEKMLELSKVKANQFNRVYFIHGTEDSIPRTIQFDVVITNFYLDLFTETSLDRVIDKIQNVMRPQAIWLVSDFLNNNKWWQSFLLRIMYHFFRTLCGIEAASLPDWNRMLLEKRLRRMKSQLFYSGFIESVVYQRQ